MNRVSKLRQIAHFLCYAALQVVLMPVVTFSHTTFCFVYIAFLLLLPQRKGGLPQLLLIGFAVGLLVDMCYNSPGIHASASVCMLYCRAYLLPAMAPPASYTSVIQPNLGYLGWRRFAVFSFLLTSLHHTVLFLPEAKHIMLLPVTLRKIVLSVLLTHTAVLITQGIPLFTKKDHEIR